MRCPLRWGEQVTAKRDVEAKVLHHCACEIYRARLARACHFLHEHSAGAGSWADGAVGVLLRDLQVGPVTGHQCQYGQWAYDDEGACRPVRKAARWLSSAPEIVARLRHTCRGGHRHQALIGKSGGGRGAPAAAVPGHPSWGRGPAAPGGQAPPEAVVVEVAVLGLCGPVAGPVSAGDIPPVGVNPVAVASRARHEENTRDDATEGQVLGGRTGDVLPAEFANTAREGMMPILWTTGECVCVCVCVGYPHRP